jgi:CBS domain-containing protein
MTQAVRFVYPDTLMSEVADIFESTDFHHIPVLDEEGSILGIISEVDYRQLQDHFTRLRFKDFKERNEKFLNTLTAEEVMTKNPSCIHHESSISTVIQVFKENLFHALPVIRGGQCIGIITTHDILQFVSTPSKSLV